MAVYVLPAIHRQRVFQATGTERHHVVHGSDELTNLIELTLMLLVPLLEELMHLDEVTALVVQVNQVRLYLQLLEVRGKHH